MNCPLLPNTGPPRKSANLALRLDRQPQENTECLKKSRNEMYYRDQTVNSENENTGCLQNPQSERYNRNQTVNNGDTGCLKNPKSEYYRDQTVNSENVNTGCLQNPQSEMYNRNQTVNKSEYYRDQTVNREDTGCSKKITDLSQESKKNLVNTIATIECRKSENNAKNNRRC